MKYTNEILINQPRQRVVELFDNQENLYKWMTDLQSFEHLSGEPSQPGAKSKMIFLSGERKTEMVETITVRDFPEKFHGTYEVKGVLNIQENYFEEVDPNTTRWISHSEFQFANFPMKLMGWLMPGAFKKQSYKFMENFKQFAESEGYS